MFDRRHGEMGEDMHADDERDGWLESMVDYVDELEKNLLVDVNDSSIFYGDFITPSPDFPCMSSSSFSSLTPSPVEGSSMTCSATSSSSSSSSSAASWAVLKSDAVEDDHVDKKRSLLLQPQAAADVMETFGYMDLMENSDIWDDPIPSSIFEDFQLQSLSSPSASSSPQQIPEQQKHTMMLQGSNSNSTDQDQEGGGGGQEGTSEDLAMFFLEWLKSNKESISAEDLRKIRLKRSTIESAARRLGGGKEGMKLLLKLILQWVQNHHLHQGKRMREPEASLFHSNYQFHNIPNPPSHWNIPHPPPPSPSSYVTDPADTAGTAAVSDIPSIVGYMGDPLISGNPVLESAPAWPPSPFALHSNYNPFLGNNIHHPPPQDFAGVNGNQYTYRHFPGNGEKLASSATKEARQKRKASQKRFLSHHSEHQNQQQHNQIAADQHARLIGSDNNFNSAAAAAQANPANWVYWPSAAVHFSSTPPVLQPAAPVQSQPSDRPVVQSQNYQRQERRQVGSSPVGPS